MMNFVVVILVSSSNRLQNLVTFASSKGASTSSNTQIGAGFVKNTAKIALADAQYVSEITYDDRLKEHSFGTWEGLNSEEIELNFPGMQEKREKDCWDFQLPEGESYAILENRLTSFLDDIDKSEDILLFCHEMVSKTLRKILLNLTKQQALVLTHNQFSFFVIDNNQMHQYNCNPN